MSFLKPHGYLISLCLILFCVWISLYHILKLLMLCPTVSERNNRTGKGGTKRSNRGGNCLPCESLPCENTNSY